jgi:hypothetical protein
LYRVLQPPARVHGEALADHMAAMLAASRAEADGVLAAGRAAAGLTQRIQESVLALIRAADKLDCITSEWPDLLAVDAVALRDDDPGMVARLLGTRAVLARTAPADAALLHGAAAGLARFDVLIAVPGGRMLALAKRDKPPFDNAAAPALAFLGQAVGAALPP